MYDAVSIRTASKHIIKPVIYQGLSVQPCRRGCAGRPGPLRDAGLIGCFTNRNLIRRNGGVLRPASLNRLPPGNETVPEGVIWHVDQA